MERRLELHQILCDILGSSNCYFQPPESIRLIYPCIIYKRNSGDHTYADNDPYSYRTSYQITVVDRDPDSEIIEKIAALPMCRFDRHYTADNLNHDSFILYY